MQVYYLNVQDDAIGSLLTEPDGHYPHYPGREPGVGVHRAPEPEHLHPARVRACRPTNLGVDHPLHAEWRAPPQVRP